jgi:chromate transporter
MPAGGRRRLTEVFLVALRLGLTSFGGPTAHIGIFREEYVRNRRWLDEGSFGELVAVTSLLPGPSSSQLGMAVGTLRAGKLGGLAAWAGFTLPSAVVMTVFGLGVATADVTGAGWLHGLELAAAAVVLTAVVAMRRALAPDTPRLALALAATVAALLVRGPAAQAAIIVVAGAIGAFAFRSLAETPALHLRLPIGKRLAVGSLAVFVALLVVLPFSRDAVSGNALALADAMYRAGALVFGGGHVVLPLLHEGVVETGMVSEDDFLAGYGAAQALPGPLTTFSAYLGSVSGLEPNRIPGAALALVAIFLPSFLLLAGVLPLWAIVREHPAVRAAVVGIGAAVVGLLAAALWDPVLRTSVSSIWDGMLVAALVMALRFVPPWAVVAIAAVVGALIL